MFLQNGEVVAELPIFEPGVMVQTLPLRTSITPAMIIGPTFDSEVNALALALFLAAVGVGFAKRTKRRT